MSSPVVYRLIRTDLELTDQPRIHLRLEAPGWQRALPLVYDDDGLRAPAPVSMRVRTLLRPDLELLRQSLLQVSWSLFEAMEESGIAEGSLAWFLRYDEKSLSGAYLINGGLNANGPELVGGWNPTQGLHGPKPYGQRSAHGRLARALGTGFKLLSAMARAELEPGRRL